MPDVRKCCIVGCDSNSRLNKNLRFFKFPEDANLRDAWLTACHKSAEKIYLKTNPLICSKHFKQWELGIRRLYQGSVPSLNLDPESVDVKEKIKQEKAEAEQNRLIKLHYDSVIEWYNRAQHHPNLLKEGTALRKQLLEIGTQIRDLLGLDLVLKINDEWVYNFQMTYLDDIVYNTDDGNKTLDLTDVINSVDPCGVIYNDEGTSDDEDKQPKEEKLSTTEDLKPLENTIRSNDEQSVVNSLEEHLGIKPAFDSVDLSMKVEDSGPKVKPEIIISTYQQALEHLKPLEDFVLHRENFRAIGLLSTLESILKSYSK